MLHRHHLYCATVSVTLLMTSLMLMTSCASAEVVTSSYDMKKLRLTELRMIGRLEMFMRKHVHPQPNLRFRRFLMERKTAVKYNRKLKNDYLHPNTMLLHIFVFQSKWNYWFKKYPSFWKRVSDFEKSLPEERDLFGMSIGVWRLQKVHNITTRDAYMGNYSGFLGPRLYSLIAFQIGQMLTETNPDMLGLQWLSMAEEEIRRLTKHVKMTGIMRRILAKIKALSGLVYLYEWDIENSKRMLEEGMEIDNTTKDLRLLAGKLHQHKINPAPREDEGLLKSHLPQLVDEAHLCTRSKDQTVEKLNAHHVCRYQSGMFVPYFRFKQEILSETPFIAIFHDVIADDEIAAITYFAKAKMNTSTIVSSEANEHFLERAAKVAWIDDQHLKIAARVSERIGLLTGHDVKQSKFGQDYCEDYLRQPAESYQVSNYGLGGHYNYHVDSSVIPTDSFVWPPCDVELCRLATFMLFLSDVEIGGRTAFVYPKVSVAPRKGNALFWYNFRPEVFLTGPEAAHAGCPVLKGEKWIATKWIRFNGNFFNRPCGLYPNSTQLDIEPFLYKRK